MKYFIDTEFIEGSQNKTIFGLLYEVTKPTIDLISIGIVCEDGREYYAISKDFNLKEAWNRWQWALTTSEDGFEGSYEVKYYWIREHVLRPIFNELLIGYEIPYEKHWNEFNYSNFKRIIKKFGKSNKQIAEEIKEFIYIREDILYNHQRTTLVDIGQVRSKIDFYAYYADYDWVTFCQLFGNMMNLPRGFPMYCKDLKQMLDEKILREWCCGNEEQFNELLEKAKQQPNYPKQKNEHNSLEDAKWNKQLYEFINRL